MKEHVAASARECRAEEDGHKSRLTTRLAGPQKELPQELLFKQGQENSSIPSNSCGRD